jgi:hypothetical protein
MPIVYAVLCVLATWFLNLFFRKWFDIVLWPRISDKWASWSQKRLKNKILALEYELENPLRGEEVIIYGITGLFLLFLNIFPFFILSLPPGSFPKVFSTPPTNPPSWFDSKEFVAWFRVYLVSLAALIGMWHFMRLSAKFRRWKYPRQYLKRLEIRIADLKAKVK